MKTFIAITFTDNTYDLLDACINSLLMSPLKKEIHVFDATVEGTGSDVKAFFRSYANYGVFLHRVKAAKNLRSNNLCKNRAMLDSIHLYKHKSGFDAYIHINPNMFFKGHALQILSDYAQLYSCISPVVENHSGIEIVDGIADRRGFNLFAKTLDSISYITGQIEESFAINYKCFALSDRYIKRIGPMPQSNQEPCDFINSVLLEYGNVMPKVNTNMFVHENLY
jgi:hypothetical protein